MPSRWLLSPLTIAFHGSLPWPRSLHVPFGSWHPKIGSDLLKKKNATGFFRYMEQDQFEPAEQDPCLTKLTPKTDMQPLAAGGMYPPCCGLLKAIKTQGHDGQGSPHHHCRKSPRCQKGTTHTQVDPPREADAEREENEASKGTDPKARMPHG